MTIPRIDAARLGAPQTVSALREAAMQTGFMTVHGTAIDAAEVRTVIEAYRDFFASGPEVKNHIDMARTGTNRGWGAPGSEQVDPAANPDYKQVFDMGFELPPGDPLAARGSRYYAPNLWPRDMPGFRSILERYYGEALDVCRELLTAVAGAVGADPARFDGRFERPMALLRGNHYPARPDWAGARDFGIAPHTDYGCLTLLATDGQAGLEVRGRDGSWIALSAPPGTFIVNFGEMLEMWTAGRIVATPHRVIGNAQERISVPLFFNPDYDTDVSEPGAPAPILAGEHLSRRYDETYLHLGRKG
ncbi:isopenicillin N synthase family dioxygenase [Profundibacterium mesophilum]|uniref:2-oxoglutarate-dependent ethylene/succinate-forming enzyme n=1 Tax=Profundibacterium mesophilum KAUST100406-0324 TaxID=1037889 RepID=A0A921NZR3_9RHOB|nr:2OG-Fe(II) oxygenase family protein [Profundibacterium mesophilum]KAF0677634.1 hydroxyacylglutathione hydrolase [Profundibacterium mesophilum KAUST100406-0324]